MVELIVTVLRAFERSDEHSTSRQQFSHWETYVILLDGDNVVCDAETISPLGAVTTASEAKAAREQPNLDQILYSWRDTTCILTSERVCMGRCLLIVRHPRLKKLLFACMR